MNGLPMRPAVWYLAWVIATGTGLLGFLDVRAQYRGILLVVFLFAALTILISDYTMWTEYEAWLRGGRQHSNDPHDVAPARRRTREIEVVIEGEPPAEPEPEEAA